ncbi:MAG: high potential iron sulfur protein [Betaproteobacteria bacterium]
MTDIANPSRRCILRAGALFAGASLAAGTIRSGEALAQQKASKESMKYQDKPNGDKQCRGCFQFIPGNNTCKVVEGIVSPQGYCISWAKKS